MTDSIHNHIITEIRKARRGSLLFAGDFHRLGADTAIRQSLSRLTREGMLIRLAQGVYLYPKQDKELGILYPSAEEIAQAVAKREKIRILPTGAYALNKLGLSTQVPTRMVYLTDGEARKLKVGKTSIVFKPTVPKKLSAKGKLSGLAIQALQELGQSNVTPAVRQRLKEILKDEDPELLRRDVKMAADWIARLLLSLTDKIPIHDRMAKA